MSSAHAQRVRRREEVEKAYDLQVRAGVAGAAKYGTLGIGLAALTHHTWPLFRRQTLAFKGFLVSFFTIYGLVTAADRALLSHENKQRLEETDLRREARIDLARRGMVATETEISKWKAERERVTREKESDTQQSSE